MAPELEAPPPDERDGEGPWGADNPDDLERVIHELEQPEPQAQLMQRLLRSHQGPVALALNPFGNTIAAAAIITTTVASVTGIYVLGSRWQRQDQALPPTDHGRAHRLARHGTRPRWPYRQRQISNRDTT